jgi:signal transduction histidine kinase
MTLHLASGYPLYERIEGLVGNLVKTEEDRMGSLRESVAQADRRAMVFIGAFMGTVILLALVLGFVISWSLILPVRAADGFLSAVSKGEFGGTISVPNRDEFGAFAAHMNRMSAALHQLDLDQRQAARQLRSLNEQLERASRAKSEFLASMSHELRTPMNAILGFTELLLDEIYGEVPKPLTEPLADIQTNGRHLLQRINDVLDLSKIEAGRMELNLVEYVVLDLMGTVQASLRSLAMEKGLEFRIEVPDDIPSAFGDAKRLIQCLLNLAGNAIKFTPSGWVLIQIERQDDRLLYSVADTGIGIPKDQLDNVFAEFRQADATIASEFGGTGLGLSLTRKFVELHGGRIWVESEVGKGSTFSSRSRCGWKRGRPHEREDDPAHRGQRVQPEDRPRPARPHLVPAHRGRGRREWSGHGQAGAAGPDPRRHPAPSVVRVGRDPGAACRPADGSHPDHRHHLLRAQRRRSEGEGGGRVPLSGEAL